MAVASRAADIGMRITLLQQINDRKEMLATLRAQIIALTQLEEKRHHHRMD